MTPDTSFPLAILIYNPDSLSLDKVILPSTDFDLLFNCFQGERDLTTIFLSIYKGKLVFYGNLTRKLSNGARWWNLSSWHYALLNLVCRFMLFEAQARIKIAGRNINNLRYADDTTLMAESKEELQSLLMKVKEESENVGLKLNIQKTNMSLGPITSWQIGGETVADYFFGLQNHCGWWLQPWT